MKAEDKLQIRKFFFMLINSLFIILGISLFGASIWILFDTSTVITVLSNETDVKVVAGGLFIIGLVVVGVSMLGCIGVWLENRCFIALAKCCGRQNASDWKTNEFVQSQNTSDIYPCSCFNGSCPVFLANEMYSFGNGTHIYIMGCEEKLKDWFEKNVIVILGMDLALLFIQILQFILGLLIFRNIGTKIKDQQPENLLNAMEENPASSSDPYQNDLENYQSYTNTSDQQLHDAYNQEHSGQSYYQYHDPQHQHNSHMDDQRWNDGYDNAGQSYDQYESQLYQRHHDPNPNHHIYNQTFEDGYEQQYANTSYNQYQGQQYQYDHDLHYRQSSKSNYSSGYVHDDYRNNYEY
ncbi:uncharacterized protein si:ch73-139j3.4 isoform X2 [Neoarius graeffei]|uniref:uncharacterized protein si:ch73-139j3.4 isoform X2 n=1 Tax=Neoarius graeffei TaxID=443677 RepID=UPI00298CC5DD|nr:uncharacterized protein si:ch73-139j3.4 isoform X2 [Neoarius graeffei]